MRFKLFVLAAVVFIGLAAVSSAFGQTGETLFSGTIDGSKVEFALTRDGESLIGDYYYRKSGSANRLKLKGAIAADGSFTMQEFTSAGKQTGTFKGKWKDDANASGAMLEGE